MRGIIQGLKTLLWEAELHGKDAIEIPLPETLELISLLEDFEDELKAL